jgi:oxalate---CoA ligase
MPIATTLVDVVRDHAQRTPDALAILAPGRPPLDYRGLSHALDATIERLAAAGFGRGDRVALALPDGPELAVALMAVSGCATCVPLNSTLDETSYRVAFSRLRVDALIVPLAATSADDTPATRTADALSLPVIRLAFAPADPAGVFTLLPAAARPAKIAVGSAADDIALVLHTSGTTEQPKAVPLTHRLVVGPALARARQFGLTAADRCLCVRPLFTAGGMRRCLFPVLAVGASVVCTPGLGGESFVAWLEAFEPTYYSGSPTIQRALIDELEQRGGAMRSTLRFILSASAALPASLGSRLEEMLGVPVLQGYGMTETGIVAQNPLAPGASRAGSVGLPVGNEFAILGDAGLWLPPGEIGEIVVRGAEVFGGYEDDPAANRKAFFQGWFRTGDLGYVDRDGFLFIAGRVKELINRGGFKVSPSAVDAAVTRHPDVVDAVTFAVPHATLGEDVVTAAVLRQPSTATAQSLRDFVFGELAAFMVPRQILLVPDLPRSAAGKVQRAEIAAKFGPHLRVPFLAPRGPHEERVARWFAEVLGVDNVGASDNFFELGGDSLHGAQLIGRVNAEQGTTLEVACLFRRPTVAEFAAELEEVAGADSAPGNLALERRSRSAYRPDTRDVTTTS